MANPTTNYSFAMPTNTDLVKDLPADFEIFGQAVDTKIKDLNPETTAGDISYRGSTANAKTRLPIGTAGQVLTVNSGATAPEWAAVAGGSLTLLSTTSLSGASVTISSINQTYKNLLVVINGLTNATADGKYRIAPNGTTNISSLSGHDGLSFSYQNNYIFLCGNGNKAKLDNSSNCFALLIYNYASSTTTKPVTLCGNFFENFNVGSQTGLNGQGGINTTTAISSLVFSNDAGNLSTGTVLIYGVK